MSEFLMQAPPETLDYLREIAEEMQRRFGISRAEAVARINAAYGGETFDEWPDLMCHELPEHWAYGLYYGDVPYWDENADRSRWQAREAPPRDSLAWTIPPEE